MVPRYYFHLVRDSAVTEDAVGSEFELVQEARGHALRVATELSRNASPETINGSQIVVVDSNGLSVFKRSLAAAGSDEA